MAIATAANRHVHALPAGHRLHEYAIERVLGYGAFGITYLARDTALDRAVAIKEYLPGEFAVRGEDSSVAPKFPDSEEVFRWGLERFLGEARVLARLDHPYVVRVLRLFEAHGTAYFVMPFEEGKDLKAHLSALDRPLTEAELRILAAPLLDGLEAVHAIGALHRDLKPANILLRERGGPLLLDFGAARQAVGAKSTLTAVLTHGYAPLEQYSGSGQGPWTDLYALGAVFYHCLAGGPVSPLPMATARSEAYVNGEADPLPAAAAAFAGRCSAGLAAALDWALHIRTKDRPQSVAEWRPAWQARPAAPAAVDKSTIATDAPPSGDSAGPEPAATGGVSRTRRAVLDRNDSVRPKPVATQWALVAAWVLTVGGPVAYLVWPSWDRPPAPVTDDRSAAEAARQGEAQRAAAEAEDWRPGWVFRDRRADGAECPECPELVVVPAGSFTMGSPEAETAFEQVPAEYANRERPQRPVTIAAAVGTAAFALGRYEVTFEEWDACTAAGGCNGYRPHDQGWGRDRRPVINVSWNDAQAYVRWLSQRTAQRYRLPSEAEWEYAARAGTVMARYWGDGITPAQANYRDSGINGTVEVGRYPANPFGLYDMLGNVWEWVEDCWNGGYQAAPADGSARSTGECNLRALRGASWFNFPGFLRAAFRDRNDTGYRNSNNGFRVARTLP